MSPLRDQHDTASRLAQFQNSHEELQQFRDALRRGDSHLGHETDELIYTEEVELNRGAADIVSLAHLVTLARVAAHAAKQAAIRSDAGGASEAKQAAWEEVCSDAAGAFEAEQAALDELSSLAVGATDEAQREAVEAAAEAGREVTVANAQAQLQNSHEELQQVRDALHPGDSHLDRETDKLIYTEEFELNPGAADIVSLAHLVTLARVAAHEAKQAALEEICSDAAGASEAKQAAWEEVCSHAAGATDEAQREAAEAAAEAGREVAVANAQASGAQAGSPAKSLGCAAREETPSRTTRKSLQPPGAFQTSQYDVGVLRKLWKLYSEVVLPLEQRTHFEHFHAVPMTLEEFESRPQVLLLGQYSTGKTSIIKWLTDMDSPHFDVRPQPSTDKFMAVVHGAEERLIYGNAAACLPQLPYQGLATFGANFLGSFHALAMPAPMLQDLTFIDTPGVLAGSKQRIGRDYDFSKVAAWMAERADLVLLTFDAHKLDISDEFEEVMEVLRPHAHKVRCVLNKADQIDSMNLVRVYGALLWNVGKILRTPEVARVYVSSFWEEEYRHKVHVDLFNEDKEAVLKELHALPRNALLRKINNFVARVRRVKAHFAVVSHVKSQLPWWPRAFGAESRQRRWVDDNLETLLADAQRIRNLSEGDMPSAVSFRAKLGAFEDWSKLPAFDAKDLARLDKVIDIDIPTLMDEVGGVTSAPSTIREELVSSSTPEAGFFQRMVGSKRKREE